MSQDALTPRADGNVTSPFQPAVAGDPRVDLIPEFLPFGQPIGAQIPPVTLVNLGGQIVPSTNVAPRSSYRPPTLRPDTRQNLSGGLPATFGLSALGGGISQAIQTLFGGQPPVAAPPRTAVEPAPRLDNPIYGGPIGTTQVPNFGPYGAPIGEARRAVRQGTAVDFSSKVLAQDYEDKLALQALQLDDDVAAIRNGYSGPISELQKVLDGLAEQGQLSTAAYARYSAAAAEIDPSVTTEGIPDSGAPATVTAVYDEAEGAVRDVLYKIDADLGTDAAMEVVSELGVMETFIQDSLRTDLDNIDQVHAAAGLAISALAEAGYATNIYESAKSKAKLEAEIAKSVEDQKDAIAKLKKQMADAVQAARDAQEFDDIELNYEDSKNTAMLRYYAIKGLTVQDVAMIQAAGRAITDFDDTSRLNEANWAKTISAWNNSDILVQVRLADEIGNYLGQLDTQIGVAFGAGDTAEVSRLQAEQDAIDRFYQTADIGGAFQGNKAKVDAAFRPLLLIGAITQESLNDATKIGFDNKQQWMVKGDEKYLQLRDLYTFEKAFENEWATIQQDATERANIIQEQFNQGATGPHSPAANNWNNRKEPAYKYRADVVAPYYADLLKRTFPGTEIGGLGYLRPPSDVGGARIANSDHSSAGAIDVYNKGGSAAQTNATLLKIQAWAAGQPGISYAVYEGKAGHQTGGNNAHVHLSFNLGWNIPGTSAPAGTGNTGSVPF